MTAQAGQPKRPEPFVAGKGRFASILGIRVDAAGRLYVLDAGGSLGHGGKTARPRVVVFDSRGKRLAEFAVFAQDEAGQRTLLSMDVTPAGEIFISDTAGAGSAPAGAAANLDLDVEDEGFDDEGEAGVNILSPGRVLVFGKASKGRYGRKRVLENLGESPRVAVIQRDDARQVFVLSREGREAGGREQEAVRHFLRVMAPTGEEVAELSVPVFDAWAVGPDGMVYGIEGKLWRFYLRGTPTGKVEERYRAGGLVHRLVPPKWRHEEVVGTLANKPPDDGYSASLAINAKGHLFVQDGKCEEFDPDGVLVQEYGKPLIPGQDYEPTGITADAKGNLYFFDRVSQDVYRLSADGATKYVLSRRKPDGFCLGADAHFEPHQFLEGEGEPELRISLCRFFSRFPGLYFRFDLEDGLGNRLSGPRTVDVRAALAKSPEPVAEVRVPISERRFGLVAANAELGWDGGVLAKQPVGFSIVPKYPEINDTEPGFIGAAHRMSLKCERGYPWPVWSAIQSRTGGDFVKPESLTNLYDQAQRLGLRLFFQLGPNSPPGESAGFHDGEDYEDYAYQMARWFEKLGHWELVNEPPAANAPEWYVENYLKPAYRGIKRADPRVKVLGLTTCGWHRGAVEKIMKCGGALYMDAAAVHIFTPGYSTAEEAGLETVAAQDRRAMQRFGLGEIPIWLTETQWRLRHTKMAEDVVRCYIHGEALGIPKEQVYYFMAHTTGFGPDWGLCGPLFPPLRGSGIRAMGMGLRVLGHYTNDKKLVSTEKWLPWLRSHLYESRQQRVYAVYSYDFRTEVALGTDAGEVQHVDFYGNVRRIRPKEGQFGVRLSGYPSYLVVPAGKRIWLWDEHEIGPNVALATMGTKATSSPESHKIFGAEHPPEGAIDGRIHREWGNLLGWVNAEPGKSPDWLILEFPHERTIRRVNICSHSQNSGCPSIKDHELFYEQDGKWVSAGRKSKYEFLFAFTHDLPDVRTKRLKVVVHDVMVWAGNWVQLYEVEAYEPWGHSVAMDIIPDWTHHDVFVAGEEREVVVRLTSCLPKPCSGSVTVMLPDGGQVSGESQKRFELTTDASVDLTFVVRPPAGTEGPYRVAARLAADGDAFPSFVGHRTVTVRKQAPEEWMPKVEVAAPKRDSRDMLSRPNARNDWTRCQLTNLAIDAENQLRLAWVKPPTNVASPKHGSNPPAMYDGDDETVWGVRRRFFDRYAEAKEREAASGKGAAGVNLDLREGGKGLLEGEDDALDDVVGKETKTIEWSLVEELNVEYVRTQFADGLAGQYELLLSGAGKWRRIAAGTISQSIVVTELGRPMRVRRSKIVLSELKLPAEAKHPGWQRIIDQILSAPRCAVCSFGGGRSVGSVETQFPEDMACEYELYVSADDRPDQSLRHPSWRRVVSLRRGTGKHTVVLDAPVAARHMATRVITAEPVGGLYEVGDFEYPGVDGFGRPLYREGVPAGLNGARFERKEAFSGRQSIRIPAGGSLINKPMPYRNVVAGGIRLGPEQRAARYLLSFYAKGAPTVWSIRFSVIQQTKATKVGEHCIEVPGSRSWCYRRFLVDAINASANAIQIEAVVDPERTGGQREALALIDDVSLVPGGIAPVADSLALGQRVLTPGKRHAEGSLISSPFEIGTVWKAIEFSWEHEAPKGTGIRLQFRTGKPVGENQYGWGEWARTWPKPVASEMPRRSRSVAQVRAVLSSSAPRLSPSLRRLHVTYEGSSVPLGTLYRGGPTPKIVQLRRNLKQFAKLRRESAWATFEIGRLYGVLGHVKQAALELRRVVEEYADLPPWAAEAMYETGELWRGRGQYDRAKEAYGACIAKFGKLDNCLYPVLKSQASLKWIDRQKE